MRGDWGLNHAFNVDSEFIFIGILLRDSKLVWQGLLGWLDHTAIRAIIIVFIDHWTTRSIISLHPRRLEHLPLRFDTLLRIIKLKPRSHPRLSPSRLRCIRLIPIRADIIVAGAGFKIHRHIILLLPIYDNIRGSRIDQLRAAIHRVRSLLGLLIEFYCHPWVVGIGFDSDWARLVPPLIVKGSDRGWVPRILVNTGARRPAIRRAFSDFLQRSLTWSRISLAVFRLVRCIIVLLREGTATDQKTYCLCRVYNFLLLCFFIHHWRNKASFDCVDCSGRPSPDILNSPITVLIWHEFLHIRINRGLPDRDIVLLRHYDLTGVGIRWDQRCLGCHLQVRIVQHFSLGGRIVLII